MPEVEFGLALDFGTERAPLGQVLDELTPLLRLAEKLGFASVVAGQTFPNRAGAFHLASPLIVLAALASRTSLRLGTGVTLQPGWQPLNLAYDAATLDQICGGRLFLGMSVGNPHDWQIFGQERATVGQRFDELLQALKALWAGEPGFDGQLLHVSQGIHPLPIQPGGPPLLIGGMAPRTARRAAALGDGYYAATQYRREDVARQTERYREALSQAGKPATRPLVAINRLTFVAEGQEAALREGREYVTNVLRRYARMNALSGLQPDDPELFDHALDSTCLVGSPDSVGAQIEQYLSVGVTTFQLRVAPADMPLELVERTISLVGERIIPRFR